MNVTTVRTAMARSPFLDATEASLIREQFGTPVYVYDVATLDWHLSESLALPHAFGLTVRYAMKANPNGAILRHMDARGLHLDASSEFEARRARMAGISGNKISLSAQELPRDLAWVAEQGILFVATSLHQLESWGKQFPRSHVAVRFNPGLGTGANQRTNVGGSGSSFGIWHEYAEDVGAMLCAYDLRLDRIHTHAGSGGDPDVWLQVAKRSLTLVEQFPSVTCLDLGGGFRVARMPHEVDTDLHRIGTAIRDQFIEFAQRTGREIRLEIEPGSYLTANCGVILATIVDIVATGRDGHEFLKVDTGMTEILRPAMYGAQHEIVPISVTGDPARSDPQTVLWAPSNTQPIGRDYVIVGHCCETGDVLTPAPGDPERIAARRLPKLQIGDMIMIGGAGAYCAAMSAAHYNSFPLAPEILRSASGTYQLARRRQTLTDVLANEV